MSKYKLIQPKSAGAKMLPRADRYGREAGDDAYVLVSVDGQPEVADLRILERTTHKGKVVYIGRPGEPELFGGAERVRFQPIHITSRTPFSSGSRGLDAADDVMQERVGVGGVLIGLAFLTAGVVAAIRA